MGTLLTLLVVMTVLPSLAVAQVEITRTPASASIDPSGSIQMTLTIETDGLQEGLIITEGLPDGWIVTSSTPSVDKRDGSAVKWFFMNKTGVQNQKIVYLLQAPSTVGSVQITSSWSSMDLVGTNYSGDGASARIDVVASPSGTGGGSNSGGGNPTTPAPSQPQPSPPVQPPQEQQGIPCAIGSSTCEGQKTMVCTTSGWVESQVCEFGCVNGLCQPKIVIEEPSTPSPKLRNDLTGRIIENSPTIAGVIVLIAGLILGVRYTRKREHEKTPQAPVRERYEYHPR